MKRWREDNPMITTIKITQVLRISLSQLLYIVWKPKTASNFQNLRNRSNLWTFLNHSFFMCFSLMRREIGNNKAVLDCKHIISSSPPQSSIDRSFNTVCADFQQISHFTISSPSFYRPFHTAFPLGDRRKIRTRNTTYFKPIIIRHPVEKTTQAEMCTRKTVKRNSRNFLRRHPQETTVKKSPILIVKAKRKTDIPKINPSPRTVHNQNTQIAKTERNRRRRRKTKERRIPTMRMPRKIVKDLGFLNRW